MWASVLSVVLFGAAPEAPIAWSPDGRWVSYTTLNRPVAEALRPGWLLGERSDAVGPSTSPLFRLWATKVETGESALLAEGPGPFSSPCWNAEGSAIAFVRLVPSERDTAHYEVVLCDTQGSRVLFGRSLTVSATESDTLAGARVAWSADGRHLAVPAVSPPGLLFLRSDNGHVLKTLAKAFQPAWSPDGAKVAFFRAGTPDELCWMDNNFSEPRPLQHAPRAALLPAPSWARDSRVLFSVRRSQVQPRWGQGQGPMFAVDLVRVRIDNSTLEPPPKAVQLEPMHPAETFLGASFSFDPDTEDLYYTTSTRGQKFQGTHRQPNGAPHCRFNPFDEDVPLGALAYSPAARRLALRVGGSDVGAGVALWDHDTERLQPLVPDDPSRAGWVAAAVAAARNILAGMPARREAGGPEIERPTLLPSPAELTDNPPAAVRLRRLGRITHAACERTAAEGPTDTATAHLLDDAHVFADYLRGDYAAARAGLDRLEARDGGPDVALRLLALRAQVDFGAGDRLTARTTLDYLRATTPGTARRFEDTLNGPVLTDLPGSLGPWLGLLADQVNRPVRPNSDEPPAAPEGPQDPEFLEPHNILDPTLLPRPAEPPPLPDPRTAPRERDNKPPRL
jgi:hypothetical protein